MTRSRITLGEALQALIDHRGKTPKKLGGDWTVAGHRVVSALNIKAGRVNENDHHYISPTMYAKWMKVPLDAGDVLLTSEAPTGEVAYLPNRQDWALGQRLFALRGKPDVLDGRYLFYALRGGDARHQLMSRTTGTTVSGIRQSELVRIELDLPSLEEQRGIAATLGALDDKIESNRRTIDLTQELSRSAYTAWRALHLDSYETTFGEFAEVFGGATPKTTDSNYWDGNIAWATPTDITGLSAPYLFGTARMITEAGLASTSATLHPAGTIFMTSRATIGSFAVSHIPSATNQGFIAVRPRLPVHRWFLFEEMRTRVPEMLDRANGSTFMELSRGNFKLMRLRAPEGAAIAELDSLLAPQHTKAAQLNRESSRLAELRDTLLPELLSGRIRVPEAREAVAESAPSV